MFPATHFRFDYESQTIRIPVWAGKINFTFGTETASYNFSDNGIYEVTFSSDWNNVTNANKISSLSEQIAYLNPAVDNPSPSPSPPPPSPSPPPYSFQYSFPSSSFSPPDTTSPTIVVVSPKNKTYSDTDTSLTFTLSEPTSWISYSLDRQANVTISEKTTLSQLPDGSHSIVVYASDLAGNIGASATVYFTKDTISPTISILSPQNTTYDVTEAPLTFAVSETTSWISYSLDGQANITITGNITLTGLPYGSHTLTVYVTDKAGNSEISETIYFIIAKPFPTMIAAAIAMAATGGTASAIYYTKNKKTIRKTEK
jgi:hypothetical protein